jgi:hypothetical protein
MQGELQVGGCDQSTRREFITVVGGAAAWPLLFAVLPSLSIGTLNARDADVASRTFAAAQMAKQTCINTCLARYRDCRRLNQVPLVRVSGCSPGLRPIHLYWFRTRMTDVPFAAVTGDAGAIQ